MTTYHPSPTLFLVPQGDVPGLRWEPLAGATGVDNKVVYDGGATVAGLLRLHPGGSELSHVHLAGEHHMWVLEGAVVIDDTTLAAGSYAHVPPRLTHTLRDVGDGSLLFYV